MAIDAASNALRTSDINRVIAVRSITTSALNINRYIHKQRQRPIRIYEQSLGDNYITSHPINSISGTANGIGGTQLVTGSSLFGTLTLSKVYNYSNVFYDDFDINDYINTSLTTATVDTTNGEVTF